MEANKENNKKFSHLKKRCYSEGKKETKVWGTSRCGTSGLNQVRSSRFWQRRALSFQRDVWLFGEGRCRTKDLKQFEVEAKSWTPHFPSPELSGEFDLLEG